MFATKKILITGAKGFIGQKLLKRLQDIEHLEVHPAEIELEKLSSIEKCINQRVWDIVVHLAGISYAPACEKDPELAFQINSQATKQLAEILTEKSPKAHLIFPSTAYVYAPISGQTDQVSIDESFEIAPANIYAQTKLHAENYLEQISKERGLKVSLLRLFNHTHYTQPDHFFLPNMYQQLQNLKHISGPELLVGNIDLNRDFGSIFDLINALSAIVHQSEKFPLFDIFNICSGHAKNLAVILQVLAEKLEVKNIRFTIDPKRLRGREPTHIVGNCHKITSLIDWKPSCITEQDLVNYFLKDGE